MTAINFKFEWYDEARTALRYSALDAWTWRDYHACMHIATFSLMHLPERSVHTIIDLRPATRPRMPSGLKAHGRTFGKRLSPALTGHAIVIGMPEEDRASLGLEADGTFTAVDGVVVFVNDDEALAEQLARLPSA